MYVRDRRTPSVTARIGGTVAGGRLIGRLRRSDRCGAFVAPQRRREDCAVNANRSVARYDRRATEYEAGVLGRWHADIAERTAALTNAVMPDTGSVLDVGCGSGALLRLLGRHAPRVTFMGVDPAPQMLAVAVSQPERARTTFALAGAEALPYRGATFDVVVSSVSFGHWPDQRTGLNECRRRPGRRRIARRRRRLRPMAQHCEPPREPQIRAHQAPNDRPSS